MKLTVMQKSMFLLIPLLQGCIGGSAQDMNFYLLEPISSDSQAIGADADQAKNVTLTLKPVRIPAYIDRPQIVTAIGEHRYELDEFNRWAEHLDQNLTRVLQTNLMRLAPVTVLLANSTAQARSAAIQIQVLISEFHVNSNSIARLTAQWFITERGQTRSQKSATYQTGIENLEYPARVTALNRCLDALSEDIASHLQPLIP